MSDYLANNYEDTAQAWARHLDQSFPVNPYEVSLCLQLMNALWRDIAPETLETIENDPHSFADRVAGYRHNMHMQHAIQH